MNKSLRCWALSGEIVVLAALCWFLGVQFVWERVGFLLISTSNNLFIQWSCWWKVTLGLLARVVLVEYKHKHGTDPAWQGDKILRSQMSARRGGPELKVSPFRVLPLWPSSSSRRGRELELSSSMAMATK
ncbi:hypothetical protein V6N11_073587 [Hibiscus sabdariffa]|uniref:Uncharacterized protein n=1 Tax=Hibiscus sabdariffa TaxID=183260 RepID=A0ABR2NTZ5_9ROSI